MSTTSKRTFGPSMVAFDCAYIGCAKKVTWNVSEQTKDQMCDLRLGVSSVFHYLPKIEIEIEAADFTAANMALALDTTATTWGGATQKVLQKVPVTWGGSTGAWTSTIYLNPEISGTVVMYSDSTGSTVWTSTESGVITVSGPCNGQIALTSSGTAEPTATLYATYYWGDQVPSGADYVAPAFGSTSSSRYLVIGHKKAQEAKISLLRVWRAEIVRNVSVTSDSESPEDMTIPIKVIGLVDSVGHSDCPMFDFSEFNLSGWNPSYEPYTDLETTYT